jgi:hypothetical protein
MLDNKARCFAWVCCDCVFGQGLAVGYNESLLVFYWKSTPIIVPH